MNGQIEAKDIPSEWNRLYKEYLGIDVPSDKEGCLQDVHWACGDFGYFPTYALGSAYASQIYHAMQKDLDVDAEIRTGSFSGIEKWLAEKSTASARRRIRKTYSFMPRVRNSTLTTI